MGKVFNCVFLRDDLITNGTGCDYVMPLTNKQEHKTHPKYCFNRQERKFINFSVKKGP